MNLETTSPKEPPPFPMIRTVPMKQPLSWIRLGWRDLRACPFASLFYGFCFMAGGGLMIVVLGGAPEYITAAITGFLIGGPFLALGLYDISRRRESGLHCNLIATLTAWRSNTVNLGLFAGVLLLIFLIWGRASLGVFALFYSGELPTMADILRYVIGTDHAAFLIAYFAVGGLFALIAFTISVVSVPLMLDRGHDAITAAIVSTRVVLANPEAMIVWAALIALLGSLGLVTFLVGILVVGPLLGHATWHAYRDLVE